MQFSAELLLSKAPRNGENTNMFLLFLRWQRFFSQISPPKSMFNSNILVSDVQICCILWQSRKPQWITKVTLQGTIRSVTRLLRGQHPSSFGNIISGYSLERIFLSLQQKENIFSHTLIRSQGSSKMKRWFHLLWGVLSSPSTQKYKIFSR